jgi:proliferating cell nuclear antigen
MQARFSKGIVFRRIIECLRDVINEGAFICHTDSITLQAMDTSHVSLVSMCLENFEEYSCTEDFFIGVPIQNLHKILKCMDPEDTLTLSADPDTPLLSLEFQKPNRTASFEMHLIDLDVDQLEIPEQKYDCNITMSASDFKKIISDLQPFGESVWLKTKKDEFTFSVQDQANITLKTFEEYTCRTETVAEFSIRFLGLFAKASVLSKSVVLRFSSDTPLLVEFVFDEGWIRYYLSPKMTD